MTVIFSKKCENGLKAVLYLAIKEKEGIIASDDIAKKLRIPKEFVSKILQNLVDHGIIFSKKGKKGGFALAKPSSKIKLIDVVSAIDGLGVFNTCVLGFPECNSDYPCPVHDKWGDLRKKAFNMLTHETINKLKNKTIDKINSM